MCNHIDIGIRIVINIGIVIARKVLWPPAAARQGSCGEEGMSLHAAPHRCSPRGKRHGYEYHTNLHTHQKQRNKLPPVLRPSRDFVLFVNLVPLPFPFPPYSPHVMAYDLSIYVRVWSVSHPRTDWLIKVFNCQGHIAFSSSQRLYLTIRTITIRTIRKN